MLNWLERVRSRRIVNESSPNKNPGSLSAILDENCKPAKSVSFTQQDVEFEIFQSETDRHEFVDVELTTQINDPKEGPKLRRRFVIALDRKLDDEFAGQPTRVEPAEISSTEEVETKSRGSPARARLSSCKKALKKFLKSPVKSGLFVSPSKNKKTRLINEDTIDRRTSNNRDSRDSGWEEMASLASSLESLTIEEGAEDFFASSPFTRGKGVYSSSTSSSSVERVKRASPTSVKDKIVENLPRVPSRREIRKMLKFSSPDSSSPYRKLDEPAKKSFSWANIEASCNRSSQRAECLRRRSDSDMLLKAAAQRRRSTEDSDHNPENYISAGSTPSRFKRRDSLREFLLGDAHGSKFGRISTIFPECGVDNEAAEEFDRELTSSKDRGHRRISVDSEFSIDSLENPGENKMAPISDERLVDLPLDGLDSVGECRQRISHSNSAPELFDKEVNFGFGSEDEIEHFASLDNLSSVLSRRGGEKTSSMAPVEEPRDYGDEEDVFSQSYSCLEDDYTINMNDSSYIITMYV